MKQRKRTGRENKSSPGKRKKYIAVEQCIGYPSSHQVQEEHYSLTSSASHGGTAVSENPLPLDAALNISCPNSIAPPLLKVSLNVPCPSQPPRRERIRTETDY